MQPPAFRHSETGMTSGTNSASAQVGFLLLQRDEEFVMGSEDLYPHYDFNFPKIREHWKQKLGSSEEAEEYLRVVDKRLGYWLQECGTWIDFEFALKHVREDLDLRDAESHLTWLALRRRVRLANEQRKRLSPSHPRQDVAELGIPIKISQDGAHDAVWHEDFRNIYLKALARERKELKKLRETGFVPARKDSVPREGTRTNQSGPAVRPRIQWIWANRLLAYLFETLLEKEAICADEACGQLSTGSSPIGMGNPSHARTWRSGPISTTTTRPALKRQGNPRSIRPSTKFLKKFRDKA